MFATFTKLKSGDWGVRVPGTAIPGAQVEVRTRAGETKRITVARVLWSGKGVSLCSIERNGKRQAGRTCVECGEARDPSGRFPSKCVDCGAPLHRDCADGESRSGGPLCQGCCY